MFNNLGWGEITTLFAIALIVFGPERLPKVAADAGRMIRELRKMAIGLTDKLKAELGPEIGDLDLASLHPKRLMEKALLDEDGNESAAAAGPGPARWRDPARSWPPASRRPTTWTRPDNRPAGGVRAACPASPPAWRWSQTGCRRRRQRRSAAQGNPKDRVLPVLGRQLGIG